MLFIESGSDDLGLIGDAKRLLEQYAPLTQVTNALNNTSSQNQNNEIKETRDIEILINKHGAKDAGKILRESALTGNILCQLFLSTAGFQIPEKNRTVKMKNDIELFTKMAAEGGDPGSQFNLALLYTKKVYPSTDVFSEQDIDFLLQAKHWHEKAVAQGYVPSIDALKNINYLLG